MSNATIRVLVIDDSALARELISDQINAAPDMEVVGAARDGLKGLEQLERLRPDVVTLDVKMPNMDGLETLDAIFDKHPVPVIMFSALTQRAADITLDALDRGALDYVAKPEGGRAALEQAGDELRRKIRCVFGADVKRVLKIRKARKTRLAVQTPSGGTMSSAQSSISFQNCCIALGISTGGPPALSQFFQTLAPPMPPIVVVQHMPAQFTRPFAQRLNTYSALTIKEADTGDTLEPDRVLISPGGRHLHLERQGRKVVALIRDGDFVSGHRPSVDVMMNCASEVFKGRCLGVVMTGMGRDGSDGCGAIRARGGYVLGQDEASSDVYGMNKVAYVEGHVDRQFSLEDLPKLLTKQTQKMFASARLQPT
ncbi:MAG: chemotaxis response regulator protein-glutamate methylesterase [Planctomycetes bacterium]|nr:chemotaxis response regulator protein-glutamate methylesterase [Planctomycetota bacterium]